MTALSADCQACLDQLDAFRRGEMSASEMAALQAHIDSCRHCFTYKHSEDALLQRLLEATRTARCPDELRQAISVMIAKASNDN
jgi:anti-sigma factor (TIGR02949 family)